MFETQEMRYAVNPAADEETRACREAIAQAMEADGATVSMHCAQLARAGHYDGEPEMAIARRAYRAGRGA